MSVNICDNIIRAEGAKAIAFGLTKNNKLKSLNLRLNRLDETRCKLLQTVRVQSGLDKEQLIFY